MKIAHAAALSSFLVCLIAASANPVMAQDIRIENYKNTISNLVSQWAVAEIKLAGKLAPIVDKLAKLEAIPDPTDEDKERIADLQKRRGAIRPSRLLTKATLRPGNGQGCMLQTRCVRWTFPFSGV